MVSMSFSDDSYSESYCFILVTLAVSQIWSTWLSIRFEQHKPPFFTLIVIQKHIKDIAVKQNPQRYFNSKNR